MPRIIHTDNYGRDYPDEQFVTGLPALSEEKLNILVDLINKMTGKHADRYYKVVPDDYKLQPGFEP